MQLRRLTALEAEKIRREHDALQAQIADLQDILHGARRILEIIESKVSQLKTTQRRDGQ